MESLLLANRIYLSLQVEHKVTQLLLELDQVINLVFAFGQALYAATETISLLIVEAWQIAILSPSCYFQAMCLVICSTIYRSWTCPWRASVDPF